MDSIWDSNDSPKLIFKLNSTKHIMLLLLLMMMMMMVLSCSSVTLCKC